MSMKHEYKKGDIAYICKVRAHDLETFGDRIEIIEKTEWEAGDEYKYRNRLGKELFIDSYQISPYPPVKAVDGWVGLVSYNTNEIVKVFKCLDLLTDYEKENYRCIPVTITAKTTTNE